MSEKLHHDFLNNSLRIEVLNRLIGEKLEQKESPDEEYKADLEKFLNLQIEYLKQL